MTTPDPTAGNPSPGDGTAPAAPATQTPQATEGQPAIDAAKPEGEGTKEGTKPEDQGKPEGAPEAYAAFTLPEGFALEGERLEGAQALFKDLGLSQDKAQKLVDKFCELSGTDASALGQAFEANRLAQIETWGTQAKEQLGAKYDETVGLARTAVQHVNDPELTEAFNTLGWGNHPALIRAFAKFGEMARESKVDGAGGDTATGSEKGPGDTMYSQAVDMRKTRG